MKAAPDTVDALGIAADVMGDCEEITSFCEVCTTFLTMRGVCVLPATNFLTGGKMIKGPLTIKMAPVRHDEFACMVVVPKWNGFPLSGVRAILSLALTKLQTGASELQESVAAGRSQQLVSVRAIPACEC